MNRRTSAFLGSVLLAIWGLAGSWHPIESSNSVTAGPTFPASTPEVRRAVAFGISPEVRGFSARPGVTPRKGDFAVRDNQLSPPPGGEMPGRTHDKDASRATFSAVPIPNPSLSFDGMSNFDNLAVNGFFAMPPDMTGDVGPDHYVQVINALVRIYDKNGAALTPAFKMSQLFAPLGTPCSIRDDGDPIALYDPLADRWLLSQFCSNIPPFRQMIAVSKTGDPTGSYFVYEFVMPNTRINDFPKFGVWPDGYYMSTEEFLGSDYAGAGLFAFDRNKMLVGDPAASFIYFNRPSASVSRQSNFLPSDLDGLRPPPAGAANTFVSYTATEYGDPQDAIRVFDFHADFANTSASTFFERPESPLPVAAFDPTSPGGRADITQPAPGDKLDSNSDRVNFRLAYRNYGSQESLVFNQTVRLGLDPYRAGVRLYELRRTGSAAFAVTEQSTIGDTASSRWIGSAAQDHQGNLAVTYNMVDDIKEPSIFYTGRLASETPGTFRAESALVVGTGVQKAFGWRWGDYSGLSVDPVDDCTFWATGEYYTQASEDFSDFTWLTRIGRFKFDECTAAPRSIITGTITNASNGQPIAGARVAAGVYSRHSNAVGSYGNLFVLPGSYSLTASAHGYRSQTVSVSPTIGQTIVQNFALVPIPVIENASAQITAESCGTNGAPEPGETVSYAVSLRNTGALNAQNLTATLLPSGGVTNPSGPQNYGSLPVNGAPVSRSFTFTAAPGLNCGDQITLTLQLQDGIENLGTITIVLQSGIPKVALRQNFDRNQLAQLPPRWTRSEFHSNNIELPSERNWRVSLSRSTSGPKSAFAPDLNQVGVNEMVTPVFRLNTANGRLTFQNWYELETTFLRNRLYDGSVLEIRIGGGPWQDILAAGGAFDSGGYDGIIDSCCSNPLAGHMGWSGRSGINSTSEFITSAVRLPAAAAGQTVQLRWRIGTDVGTSREGQYIDDVLVTDGFVCGCQ